jgi:hypothetical protein
MSAPTRVTCALGPDGSRMPQAPTLVGLGRTLHPIVVGGVGESDTPLGEYRIHIIERDATSMIAGDASIELHVGAAGVGKPGRRRRVAVASVEKR